MSNPRHAKQYSRMTAKNAHTANTPRLCGWCATSTLTHYNHRSKHAKLKQQKCKKNLNRVMRQQILMTDGDAPCTMQHCTEITFVVPCADAKSLFLTISSPESYTPQTSSPCFHYSSFAGSLQTPTLSLHSFTLFRRFLTNSAQSCLPRPKSCASLIR